MDNIERNIHTISEPLSQSFKRNHRTQDKPSSHKTFTVVPTLNTPNVYSGGSLFESRTAHRLY
jgi:hypothetical protein